MNIETSALDERISRLEVQTKRLQRIAYLLWPAAWLVTTFSILATTKLDAAAMRILLDSIGGTLAVVIIIALFLITVFFVVKTASDFKSRRSYLPLNPGSRKNKEA